ncbi:Aste57867_8266 [Aphanomyces stellatus]|uniref:Aste57867_8266 protein n=1 Tax=Aphanomyces stellatus TaxID=120398 RepID=A0A485KJY5_9STRA|nr:hypothetical protein As57867_008235 [Aphanomyces stellatus]VFT85153.1 Aste57867_8266 [Aphanomyces stellatus]
MTAAHACRAPSRTHLLCGVGVALLCVVVAAFAYIFTLPVAFRDTPPPPFNVSACDACTMTSAQACAKIFPTQPLQSATGRLNEDASVGLVCPASVPVPCCCPVNAHADFLAVKCADKPSATTCLCRFEELCGDECTTRKMLVPFTVGAVAVGLLFVLGCVVYCQTCCSKRLPEPMPPSSGRRQLPTQV